MEHDDQTNPDPRPALLAAFTCGILAGIALGLLFAPARGLDTRDWMAERGRIARGYLRERNRRALEIVRRGGVRGLLQWQQRESSTEAGGDAVAGTSSVVG